MIDDAVARVPRREGKSHIHSAIRHRVPSFASGDALPIDLGRLVTIAGISAPIVSAESHAVIEEAKAAGVYVFGGGIEEEVDPVLVSADGSVSTEIYPGSEPKGGLTVLELPTRDDAVRDRMR